MTTQALNSTTNSTTRRIITPRPATDEAIIVINYGSQYSRLITRRLRELGVYSELVPPDIQEEAFREIPLKGVILSGGPFTATEASAPKIPAFIEQAEIPILGICYGMQLSAHAFRGQVSVNAAREYGRTEVEWSHSALSDCALTRGLPSRMSVWMSHGDSVTKLPPGFTLLARTASGAIAAIQRDTFFGLQFHPEVTHSEYGSRILKNFVFDICGCKGTWKPEDFVAKAISDIRSKVGSGRVVCGLSGGVDSAVTATLVHQAIGDRLTCVCVDNGLLRQGEFDRILDVFVNHLGMNVRIVDATDRYVDALDGESDPEKKRKIIGRLFIEVFQNEISSLGKVDFLAQGTLYPDVIESAGDTLSPASVIKSHHNVGGLPDGMRLQLIEPLRYLFKDEVRKVGLALGLPQQIVQRQPFPGPGLAVRIVGRVDRAKIRRLQQADSIVRQVIEEAGSHQLLWQYFCVLAPDLKRVGVMGDHRSYGETVIVRAVSSEDGMTAEWAKLAPEVLERISTRIVNEVEDITTVLYDITNKPPATIEWE